MSRVPGYVRVLAVVHTLLVAFTAMVGSFADGGMWWERAILVGINPVAAVALLVLTFGAEASQRLVRVTVLLLLVGVASVVVVSLAISTGVTRGDWWLPLVLSVVPLIALFHCAPLLRRS